MKPFPVGWERQRERFCFGRHDRSPTPSSRQRRRGLWVANPRRPVQQSDRLQTVRAQSPQSHRRKTCRLSSSSDDISKSFPGVQALDRVHFNVRAGEVHALLGENGAGKSTLIKIISGVHEPDGGTVELDGEPVRFGRPAGCPAEAASPRSTRSCCSSPSSPWPRTSSLGPCAAAALGGRSTGA